jgi:hypothetical protein
MRAPHLETMTKTIDLLEMRSELEPSLGPIVEKWKHRLSNPSLKKPRHEIKKPPV